MNAPSLTVLSLGGGVPDCAIFADTGWEPPSVYEHVAMDEAVSGTGADGWVRERVQGTLWGLIRAILIC